MSILPKVIIACRVLQDMFESILPKDHDFQLKYLEYGLHDDPKKMYQTLQDELDRISQPSLVIFGYGLCGNGLMEINSGPHTLLIPRVDDCIAILLGSYEAYMKEFHSVPGSYYLSKGWLESGSHPHKEYKELSDKYGKEKAMLVLDMQYQNYERICLVAHTEADLKKYRPQAREVAKFCERWNYRYEEIMGSDAYIRKLIEVAADVSKADHDFVVIHPRGRITQNLFFRS